MIEVRLDQDGNLAEVVAEEGTLLVHLEQIADNRWWLCVRQGKQAVRVILRATRASMQGTWDQDGEEDCQVVRLSAPAQAGGRQVAQAGQSA